MLPKVDQPAAGLTPAATVGTKPSVPSRPTATLIIVLLTCGLGGGLWALVALVQRDRAELVSRFSEDRERQLERAVLAVSDAIDDVFEDVRFAAELLSNDTDEAARRRALEALLEAIGQYRAVGVYGSSGEQSLVQFDRRAAGTGALRDL